MKPRFFASAKELLVSSADSRAGLLIKPLRWRKVGT